MKLGGRQVTHGLSCVAVLLLAAIASGHAAAPQVPTITETEAQILLYVSPPANTVRASGGDVEMFLSPRSEPRTRKFYWFQMRDYKTRNAGSNLVDNMAVNKFTAEVWNLDEGKQVADTVLRGVQNIIRQHYNITNKIMERYGGKPPW